MGRKTNGKLQYVTTQQSAVPRSWFRVPCSCSQFEFEVQSSRFEVPRAEKNSEHEPGTWNQERGTAARSLWQRGDRRLRAFVGDGHITLHRIGADHIRVRTTGLTRCERRNLHLGAVEVGVVRKQDIGTGLGHDVAKPRRGGGVGLKSCLVGPEIE